MARIRTIKPEFTQSESMGNVSRDARLLFVQLWTICDDSGRTRAASRMLASLLFPYDNDAPDLIDDWLDELDREGCIVRYRISGTTYLQVCNWLNHQKIDKPSQSKIPEFDEGSRIVAKPREASSLEVDLGVDLGEDQDQKPLAALCAPTAKKVSKPKDETELQAACRETWRNYREAFFERYGTEPLRNAKVNAAVKGFVQRVGHADAPLIARFYVGHNDAFYVRKCHDVGLLQSDAEKLRTEWATNRKVTSLAARQQERAGTMADTVQSILAERGATA